MTNMLGMSAVFMFDDPKPYHLILLRDQQRVLSKIERAGNAAFWRTCLRYLFLKGHRKK
jgi:hypothetical protein